jgi:hypothetical protein
MFGNKHSRDDERQRQQLGDDIRRCAGFMQTIIEEARRLDVTVPSALVVCTDAWRGWHRSLAARRVDPPRETE